MTRIEKPKGRGACPTHLVARIREAQAGGKGGYTDVGAAIVSCVGSLSPHDIEDDAWGEKIEQLGQLFVDEDGERILAWFDLEVPRVMSMIPRERRANLLRGMYSEVESCEGDCFTL